MRRRNRRKLASGLESRWFQVAKVSNLESVFWTAGLQRPPAPPGDADTQCFQDFHFSIVIANVSGKTFSCIWR